MAKYIDRKDLDFLNDFRIDGGKYAGLRLDVIFDELATANVIPLEKIKQAREEIAKLDFGDFYDHTRSIKEMILPILDKLIESEDKE